MSLRIAADQYLQNVEELLPEEAHLFRFDPSDGLPDDITKYDALLIRTVTPITPETLPETGNLKFIGSATAGVDHINRDYLKEQNVEFSHSEGCNANAVGEYVITVLYKWAEKMRIAIGDKTVGIVGCGHTGSAVIHLLNKLGINHVDYDPPREIRDQNFKSASSSDLIKADILTFHTPLTSTGSYPTKYLCSSEWLENGFDLIINASRGGVVDEHALFDQFNEGVVGNYILDVWEDEPFFDDKVAKHAFLSTPHIAGYSVEAKFRATEIVLTRLLNSFGLKPNKIAKPKPYDPTGLTYSDSFSFSEFMWKNNQVYYYSTELQKLIGLPSKQKSLAFADLRSKTTLRHEYSAMLKSSEVTEKAPQEFSVFDHSKPD